MNTKLVPVPGLSTFDNYRLKDEMSRMIDVTQYNQVNIQQLGVSVNEALKHMGERVEALSGFNDELAAKIETLMQAIKDDVEGVRDHCPNVLKAASDIAIRDGKME